MFLHLRLWATALTIAALAGCASLPPHIDAELKNTGAAGPNLYAPRPFSPLPPRVHHNSFAPNWQPPPLSALKSGQLLVWGKRNAAALFVGLFAQDFRPWSHIGIVSVEADGVYVYETDSAFVSTSEKPPTESATGGMRHMRFTEHVAADYIFGVYDPPPGVDIDKMLAFAQEQFQRGVGFDAYFDSVDHQALYCSELIALALEAGGAPAARLTPVRANRSYDVIRNWLRIHPDGFYLPSDFISPERQVALWSRDLSPAQIQALFAAQQELASRFGDTTPLGHLMQWSSFSTSMLTALTLREAPQRFINASLVALADDQSSSPDTLAIQRRIKQLANQFFLHPTPER